MGAVPGSSFADRCDEILNAGPGSEDRRSSAATGSNLDLVAAQGRLERERKKKGESWELGKASYFVAPLAVQVDRDASDFENGFESTVAGVVAGFDYRSSPNFVWGGAIGYSSSDTDYDDDAGELDTDSLSLTGYATIWSRGGHAFDFYATYASLDYETVRNINYSLVLDAGLPTESVVTIKSVAESETDGDQQILSALWSYDIGEGAATIAPRIRATYLRTKIDGYSETDSAGLAMAYEDQTIRSLQAAAGLEAMFASSRSWGVFTLQLRSEYVREISDDERTIESSFIQDSQDSPVRIRTEEPDRDLVRAGIALTGALSKGFVLFLDYERLLAHSFLNDDNVSLGIRYEF